MGLGKLLERNLDYQVTDTQTGDQATYTLITDGGPGMYAGWGDGPYRGGMGIPAAWRLALLVANQLGRVPWDAYRKLADHPSVQLPDQPLLTMPAGTTDTKLSVFRSWGLDRLWHGNAIGIIAMRSPLGYPTAVTPVSAENVQVKRFGSQAPFPGQEWIPPGFVAGDLGYLIGNTWFHAEEIVHFKGPCKPGDLRGMGVLEAHFDLMSRSRKLGAAATAVDSAAVPTGLLRSLNPDMSPAEAQELKDSWRASQRERTVAVLNPLTEFTPIAWNPTETQLLESRQYDVVDWSNVFGVSASYAGGMNPSRVYANIEDQGLDLLRYGTPGDIIAEFEEVLSMLMPRGQYVKANLDHVLRADTKSRYEAHSIAIASGFMTRNEVRELEERQPLTPEQEQEVAEATAPAPAAGPSGNAGPTGGPNTASNQAGTGKAKPRLAAVRAAFERGRHSAFDPDQPRDPDGQWSDGHTNMLGMSTGGPGRRRQPATAASSAPSADDDEPHGDGGEKPGDVTSDVDANGRPIEIGRHGVGGVRIPGIPPYDGYGGGDGTGLKRYKLNTDRYCPDCGGKAQDPQYPDPKYSAADIAVDGAPLWFPSERGDDVPERDDSPYHDPSDPEYQEDRARAPELPALPEPEEFEPGYIGPEYWPDRTWFPGEAKAWAADDAGLSAGAAAGGLMRAAAGQEALHRYWTAGPGLAKWRGSPTPWRTLRAFLSKYLSGEKLDATTSAWYRDVFGHLPEMRPKRKPSRKGRRR
jgi:HK97 family phage portal protein